VVKFSAFRVVWVYLGRGVPSNALSRGVFYHISYPAKGIYTATPVLIQPFRRECRAAPPTCLINGTTSLVTKGYTVLFTLQNSNNSYRIQPLNIQLHPW